jgi:DNA/RNA-binding domain of Phe-tRNA-synthetase-like protein
VAVIPDFLSKMLAEHMLAYPGKKVFTAEQGGLLRVANFRNGSFTQQPKGPALRA